MTDSQGVEIESCPACRGVWLNRCELDKLIERTAPQLNGPRAEPVHGQESSRGHDGRRPFKESDFGHGDHDRAQRGQQAQRRTFWRELFD